MKPMEKNNAKPQEVKIHRRPKTERKYERVADIREYLRVLEKHGDRVVFSYFDKFTNYIINAYIITL